MKTVIVTGSGGLVGGESVGFFSEKGFRVIGIENDMRAIFFGEDASVKWQMRQQIENVPGYKLYPTDIRDIDALGRIFSSYESDIELIIHAAAQPSHDWATGDPVVDFDINAKGTLNLLEAYRKYCPKAVFIHLSTNKVYGDNPNKISLVEKETRWDIGKYCKYYEGGIDESMSIDDTTHSLFGASKLAADIYVQEYGRYFGLKTGIFRCSCLTGGGHSGTQLHGFLSYLMKCVITGTEYTIFGYKGKQVRDNLHSKDLINMFWEYYKKPKRGEVYNIGGGRANSCSILEAIDMCEAITNKILRTVYSKDNRIGDHKWYISDIGKFIGDFPNWSQQFNLGWILTDIYLELTRRIDASTE